MIISSFFPSRTQSNLLKTKKGIVSTRPIKGTYPRGRSIVEDKRLQLEMSSSEKEIAEHLMLVDLKKHDLSKICKPGSVHWSDFRIEALPTVISPDYKWFCQCGYENLALDGSCNLCGGLKENKLFEHKLYSFAKLPKGFIDVPFTDH